MKTVFALLLVVLAGCNSSDFVYYLNGTEVYPEFEWVEPLIFQDNLNTCRHQPTCSVDQLFDRY